ncbi:hypothetical protein BBD32_02955 [Elizabethkingia anophelis]|uniref:Uncharacterized protein n=1 Tax=Elizabethkingia anophelis TaxID=1117645 RepID=A0AAU8UVW0_9FLAO|nr:hypothetical protein BBD32_02955 [Elizabethkingia anophelis]
MQLNTGSCPGLLTVYTPDYLDLLRNEFYDNQIIMSTHEDMMSAFMRYKFKNYNLSEKRINLKELATE